MSLPTANKIEILPEHIIDQIKAGEVLERPASLLKELIENSLDAHSTEIHIHLIENGMDLLSIEDNGHGMNFANLPYAFLRHATSKLKTFEDLYRLHSFGFRGEALASVAASARLTCISQPVNLEESGGKIIISGGVTDLLVEQKAATHGTSLFIKDLFFNTPARLKFIKSKVSEKSAIKKMIYSFTLAHPQVTFTIKWDEKEKEIFKAVEAQLDAERVAQVFFGKRTDTQKILFAEQSYDGYHVKVYFSPETYTTPQYRHHYLFVNKRFFQDKSLHQTVLRNLGEFWRFGDSGHYLVDITTPPQDIDVNVHPNKTQIKFLRTDVVYSLLVTALKAAAKSRQVSSSETSSTELSFINQDASAVSFFSKNENQTFDLMGMSESTPVISRPFSASYDNELPRESREFSHLYKLTPGYALLKTSTGHELIDLKKMIIAYLSHETTEFIRKDELPGPLLISEPFKALKGKIDEQFESLKILGFEFDRLNAEYIVLRTIPNFLPQSMLQAFTSVVIQYFSQPKFKTYESSLFRKFFEENFNDLLVDTLSDNQMEDLLNNSSFLGHEFKIQLTPERMGQLFKS